MCLDLIFRRACLQVIGADPLSVSPCDCSPNYALPELPGIAFDGSGTKLIGRAAASDTAIRAGLTWFKHRYPGQPALIEGPDVFRRRAAYIAANLGIPLQASMPEKIAAI